MNALRLRWHRPLGERGQSMAELAIVLPVLLGLVIAIFEIGRAWNVRQVLTNATREGARVAVVTSTTNQSTVTNTIDAYLSADNLNPASATITINGFGGGPGTPCRIDVSYPYQFQFLGPLVDLMGGDGSSFGTITLTSTTIMRNE